MPRGGSKGGGPGGPVPPPLLLFTYVHVLASCILPVTLQIPIKAKSGKLEKVGVVQ